MLAGRTKPAKTVFSVIRRDYYTVSIGMTDSRMGYLFFIQCGLEARFIGIMLSVCLCGCGSTPVSAPQSDTYSYEQVMEKFNGEIEQGATIRVLDNQMAVETGYLSEVLSAFNEHYKEYGVNAVDANMDQYVDLEQNEPDGYGPDVLYQANDMLMRYAQGGHILPIPIDELETEQIPQTLLDAYLMKTYGLDLYYGMPIALQSTVLTYRKDLLPQNWQDTWDKNKDNAPDMVQDYSFIGSWAVFWAPLVLPKT